MKLIMLILAMGLMGCDGKPKFDPDQYLREKASQNVERYKLIQLGSFRRDQFLLDSSTGKMWNPRCTKLAKGGIDCDGDLVWVPATVEGL